jgi:phytoene dehydrogenase-like protein
MTAYLASLGGEIATGWPVKSIAELPDTSAILFDVTPRQLISIAGECFPTGFRGQLERYRYGPGIFKIDWALHAPAPWKAQECCSALTIHLGGTLEEIAYSERVIWEGKTAEKPYVLFVQPTISDPGRAPNGKHIAWAYCDCIIDRSVMNTGQVEAYNPNYVGGDINGGVQDLRQFFTRPTLQLIPYKTPDKRIYICSSSTPPGGGVHGMCGYHAARVALRNAF